MPYTKWTKVGANVMIGGGAGVIDQIAQNADEKRRREKEAAGEKLGLMMQFGTYYNYGVPILAVLGSAFDFLPGDWSDRFILMGSQLAGRKVTYQITKAAQSAPWRPVTDKPPVPQTQKPGFEKVGIL